jgi:hypothetical protein
MLRSRWIGAELPVSSGRTGRVAAGLGLAVLMAGCRMEAPSPAPDAGAASVLAIVHVPEPGGAPPCPPGTERKGAAPPDGIEVWCERDGHREGPSLRWHANGNRAEALVWRGGKRNGPSTLWAEDGALGQEGAFTDDQRIGRWVTYSEGRKAIEGDFLGGEQHGLFIEYGGNGRKIAEGQFRHGEACGQFDCWDWESGVPTGCVPLEGKCPLTDTGADCPPCAGD